MACNVRLLIAYDGTSYLGWQKTHTGPSIEGTLQEVLEKVLQTRVCLQAASRTDAGVHAVGQVVNFLVEKPIDCQKLLISLNSLLPKDIAVLETTLVPPDFHPTLDAISKEYHYHLCYGTAQLPQRRLYSWHYPHCLEIEVMQKAAEIIVGTHDFAAFCNFKKNSNYKSTVRTVTSIEISESSSRQLLFVIKGENFLYKMVRNIVGTLTYVGCGKLSIQDIPAILQGQDRTQAGITAPAHGLTLFRIVYKT